MTWQGKSVALGFSVQKNIYKCQRPLQRFQPNLFPCTPLLSISCISPSPGCYKLRSAVQELGFRREGLSGSNGSEIDLFFMSKPALCLPSLYAGSLVSTPSLISTLACSPEVSPDALSDRTGFLFLSKRVQISSPHSAATLFPALLGTGFACRAEILGQDKVNVNAKTCTIIRGISAHQRLWRTHAGASLLKFSSVYIHKPWDFRL